VKDRFTIAVTKDRLYSTFGRRLYLLHQDKEYRLRLRITMLISIRLL